MSAEDTDDVLVAALEPGERIVWSDRPHRISSTALHMLLRRLTTWTSFLSFVFLGFVVFVFMRAKEDAEADAARAFRWETIGMPLVLGVAALPILIETFRFLHQVARTSSHRYAVTDRGRGIFVLPDVVGTFPLPRPESIATRAPGDAEHGDVELGVVFGVIERSRDTTKRGPRQIVFRSVSYPLVAVETIRSVAGGPGAAASANLGP